MCSYSLDVTDGGQDHRRGARHDTHRDDDYRRQEEEMRGDRYNRLFMMDTASHSLMMTLSFLGVGRATGPARPPSSVVLGRGVGV